MEEKRIRSAEEDATGDDQPILVNNIFFLHPTCSNPPYIPNILKPGAINMYDRLMFRSVIADYKLSWQ